MSCFVLEAVPAAAYAVFVKGREAIRLCLARVEFTRTNRSIGFSQRIAAMLGLDRSLVVDDYDFADAISASAAAVAGKPTDVDMHHRSALVDDIAADAAYASGAAAAK